VFETEQIDRIIIPSHTVSELSYCLRIIVKFRNKSKGPSSGVPQGSVLGPLLFILFINDLELAVASSRVSFFADDTRVSKRIGCFEDCLLLQADLHGILDWSSSNNMKLHEQKFELLNHLHNRKSHCSELPFPLETLLYKVSSEEIL